MFKTTLTFLAIGALSVSALTVPVARSPAPEPECEFLDRSPSHPYHTLPRPDQPWFPLAVGAGILKREPGLGAGIDTPKHLQPLYTTASEGKPVSDLPQSVKMKGK